MTIDAVAPDEPIQASTQNKLIANANTSPGRVIFTSSGIWSVPAGVFQFKVTLAGGGGKGGDAYGSFYEGFTYLGEGGRGGDAPMCSKIISGQDTGASFAITIGAGAIGGGLGGTTSFGALLQSTGGGPGTGGASPPAQGSFGTHNGQMLHTSQLFLISQNNGYGQGGAGGNYYGSPGNNGNPGICVIEW